MKNIVIIGATSAIAIETAKFFAKEGAKLFLVARNYDKVMTVANDLLVRGAVEVGTDICDLSNIQEHTGIISNSTDFFGAVPDAVLIAYGTLPDQKKCETDSQYALQEFATNATSVISLMMLFAEVMKQKGAGTIAVISSVAGDRGRGSNYLYGSAKGAVSLFSQGLRNSLFKSGVKVVTIKPGFVDTPMTKDVPKNPLFATAEDVGISIAYAMKSGKNVVYLPFFWKYIMMIIKSIPEAIFKKLSL
jgi:decaprenylphospho-beta-D-erythro-pentofuranosid-2-ulose 2-reductase